MGIRVLIIKLAALGDVLRTTPLLSGLKRKYKDPHITWVTHKEGIELLKGIDDIDRLLPFDTGSCQYLTAQEFDILICLDKEYGAIGLSQEVKAREKFGFGMTPEGSLTTLNPESEYALQLGIDDTLKFTENEKTYPEIIFEMCRLEYRGEGYQLPLNPDEVESAKILYQEKGISGKTLKIGLNTGAGAAFTHKAWTEERYIELIREFDSSGDVRFLLLGGKREAEKNKGLKAATGDIAIDMGSAHTISQFTALISQLDLLVTGDTLAMHLAIGLSVPVVVLFGPTTHKEIDLFGLGEKVVSKIDCAPCYRSSCDKSPHCMELITTQEVAGAIWRVLGRVLKLKKGGAPL